MNAPRAMPASSEPRAARRPQLLLLVYGVFLVLVAITASALVATTTSHVRDSVLQDVLNHDRALVKLFVQDNLRTTDLAAGVLDADRAAVLESRLAALIDPNAIVRIALINPEGEIVASDQVALRGTLAPATDGLQAALTGDGKPPMLEQGTAAGIPGPSLASSNVIEEYLPLLADGQPLGTVAVWRDATGVLAEIAQTRNDVLLITLVAAAVLAAILFFIFRAAQLRLTRQQRELVAATNEDPLTGLLNHGAVVALLAAAVETSTRRDDRMAVALIDVDNFRLLNDTHSHEAGDEVLVRVAGLLPNGSREHDRAARYGPDEFLVVRSGASAEEMEALVAELRERLADLHVQFGDSERLPVTISAGIALLPDHAEAVTELLAAAAAALTEAKASGGNGVRLAHRVDPRTASAPFNVLQGLVIAVDTKDRYTRRHSEDVARYAVFLARRLGLDDVALRSLHLSGLLHDVGKIAIPDTILRKPGKLTAAEYEVFKQHVALGDAIVRDLPDIDAVRSAIRTHHERWDGRGYLGGLEGEEIPLIGRILAVADAFSAMTTSRPYRKALEVTEALKRLGDAAGSQLEEPLVKAFIEGIETAEDAPLPGDDARLLWFPDLRVA